MNNYIDGKPLDLGLTADSENEDAKDTQAKPQPKLSYKPGRVDGKNSKYKSGSHFVPKKIKHEIEVLLSANRDKAAKSDKSVSARTQEIRDTTIHNYFSDLFKLGYKIQTVKNLKPKHLEAVFKFLEEMGQSPSSIQNKISTMRIFAGWIGKGDMVKESSHYVKDKASARRTTVAQEDKSWVGNGIDVLAKLAEVSAVNPIVGILLELCWTFGMRMQEAVMFRPVVAINEWGVWIIDGTKGGGRGRFVPIETELQIVVLGRALAHADGKTGFIGKRGITVKQKLQHFKDEMKKFGITLKDSKVTVHGLRHQFIHEMYKKLTGIEPPIRGGDISKLDKQTLHRAKQRLVELAGHTRTSINTAYSGSDRNPKSTQSKEVKSSESKADETSAPHKQEKE